ncbi:hypothetical protein HDV04_002847, partial [Boothiomyces sp. JEL0838]
MIAVFINLISFSTALTTGSRKLVTGSLPIAAPYAQCGGIGYTGPTACPSGYYCNSMSNYYSGCSLGTDPSTGSTGGSSGNVPSTSTSSSSGTVAQYGQCVGGQGYSGPVTCASGLSCVYSSDWYSQCLAAPSQGNQPAPVVTVAPAGTTQIPPSGSQGGSSVPVSTAPVPNPVPAAISSLFNYPTAQTNLRPGGSC